MANPNNKPTSAKSAPAAQSGRDEIEQIMDEIEMLQQEIDSAELTPPTKTSAAAPVAQAAPVTAKPASPATRQPQTQAPAQVQARAQAPAPAPKPEPEHVNELEELGFGTGDADSSLEDTLADLKEEPSSGNGALDQPVSHQDEEFAEEFPEELNEEVVEEETVEEEEIADAGFEETETVAEENTRFEEEEESPMTASPSKSQSQVNANGSEGAAADSAADGSLTMTLKGSMTLNLQYDCDGQTVTVGFSDGALKVQLADGTEFKIPMRAHRGGSLRRVA